MTASFTHGAVGVLLAIVLFVWLLFPTEKQDARARGVERISLVSEVVE